jgi:hypothetical protein
MTTIYLGDSLVSYDGPRFSHLSKEAREVAYFEQFRPENLREIRAAPMVTVVGAALIGFLALGAPFSVDAECALSCGCGPAVSPAAQPWPAFPRGARNPPPSNRE